MLEIVALIFYLHLICIHSFSLMKEILIINSVYVNAYQLNQNCK
jgi:hypothetical protein